MDESTNTANKKKAHQKPPLSVSRIVYEILAGTAAGLAVAVPVAYVLAARSGGDCFGVGRLLAAAVGFVVIPPVYAIATAVGVYLLGSRANQKGSFLLTLVGGLVGGIGMFLLLPIVALLLSEKVDAISVLLLAFASLIPPITATYGFNSRWRYKKPPSI